MKKLFAVKKYLPVGLALGVLAAAGPAPAFAHKNPAFAYKNQAFAPKNSGLTAYARAPAIDYYNTEPTTLGPADRFGAASQR